ncbi:cadherin-1 [Silurus asotus]|uniref:Cadherin-1 n=1 Tax=Silurus asotus TaxID=30991 RepID=A0AAD5AP49_SILAS|nr:cadherin-1 [Silurus asotus]
MMTEADACAHLRLTCASVAQPEFTADDAQYHVDSDGTVKLRKQANLHDGHKMFSVHAWDSSGKKHTALVKVEHQGGDVDEIESAQTESPPVLPILVFPKSSSGLRRQKREWVIPPIKISENDRGIFPKKIVQIISDHGKETKMMYRITGEGADQPPVGLFTIDKNTGQLYVSKPLDREQKDIYKLQAHAWSNANGIKEPSMEIIVKVIDQNDNSPVFTQDVFPGFVQETAKIGLEFMTITATDADDPDTDNADIRYFIISQTPSEPNPNMFAINPITGTIRVNAEGLDRQQYHKYTLEIQAADMQGEGRPVTAKAVIIVTDQTSLQVHAIGDDMHDEYTQILIHVVDQNDNKPVFSQDPFIGSVSDKSKTGHKFMTISATDADDPNTNNAAIRYSIINQTPPEPSPNMFEINPVTGAIGVNAEGLDKEDSPPRKWEISHIGIPENERGPFPKQIAQIKSSHASQTKIMYSLTGEGANQDPVGVFTVDKINGWLSVTTSLDREKKDEYVFHTLHYPPTEGFLVMTISATDADNPNTENAKIRYSIISQDPLLPHPNMFAIDPITGELKVNAEGLDKETEPTSDLLYIEFPKSGGLRRRKREWVIPPIKIMENERGTFPKPMVQIKSGHAKETKMVYAITGEGANQPPVGLFTIDKYTGWLSVSKPLDREARDKYVLQAHARSATDGIIEPEMEVIVEVTDQNDNSPVFTQNPFIGSVPEASKIGFEFMTINATDADDPNTDNADIRYFIISQIPDLPYPNMFDVNPVTGAIRVNSGGLDRENYPEYTLEIQAADMQGQGRPVNGKAVITVTDSNDNAPQFEQNSYTVSVPEDKVGALVVKMPVTDEDEVQSDTWAAKFKFVSGNAGGFFTIVTGPNQQEGIITTPKALDFEKNNKYTLVVAVENTVPFAKPLPTSTATVIVNVLDVNDAPEFDPPEKFISKPENTPVDGELTLYTATDPDIGKKQIVTYRIGSDPAGYLNVNKDTGLIKVKSPMDRESHFVKDGKYKALILAIDNDEVPATGTGTLVIELEDVNDNAPVITERAVTLCNKETPPVYLSVTDKDGPGFAAPFSVQMQGESNNNWIARMNDSKTVIILTLKPKTQLDYGVYNIVLRVFDNHDLSQDNIIDITICECTGNLKAADNDPTAPPYDSLLVFDYEGGGSEAGSLSSLNSSSSGDQDYNCLGELRN